MESINVIFLSFSHFFFFIFCAVVPSFVSLFYFQFFPLSRAKKKKRAEKCSIKFYVQVPFNSMAESKFFKNGKKENKNIKIMLEV